jgi:hypothetical protein
MRIDESKIAPENRIPRVTAAIWYVIGPDGILIFIQFSPGNTIAVLSEVLFILLHFKA